MRWPSKRSRERARELLDSRFGLLPPDKIVRENSPLIAIEIACVFLADSRDLLEAAGARRAASRARTALASARAARRYLEQELERELEKGGASRRA